MVSDGRDRYHNRLEKLKSTSVQKNPHKLVTDSLYRVSEKLTSVLNSEKNKVIKKADGTFSGSQSFWYKDLSRLDPDILGYIGLTTLMDGVTLKSSTTKTLSSIGNRVMWEIYALDFKEFNNDLSKRALHIVSKGHSSSVREKEKAVKRIAEKNGFEFDFWLEEKRVKVATPIFNAVLECSEIFLIWEQYKNNRTIKRIGLTDVASERLAELDFVASWKEPMKAPMVVQPKDWESYNTGCYLEPALSSEVTLVRSPTSEHKMEIDKAFKDRSILPTIYALNAIQRTEFTINKTIVDAVEWCWKSDKSFGKFPRRKHIEAKKKPDNWDDMSKAEQNGWRFQSKKVVIKNREIDGLRAVMSQDLSTARELQEYDKFWLPHNLDFRGRVYPIPHFSHHRDDHIKAMFEFSNGKKLGIDGAKWLAIHLATVGDFDKCSKKSFDDRIQWVLDNQKIIESVANSYEDTFDYWSTADKPFQFLASCIHFVEYLYRGDDYVCGLPIALDGSNSGVQHYSASARSKADGQLVNLTPSDKPQDIYQAVADKVLEQVKLDAKNDCPLANMWLKFGITRKIVKRNTMTYGYSSQQFGFKNQIMEDTMRGLSDKVLTNEIESHPFGTDEGFQASNYLAKKNWIAINQVIESASIGMSFFKDLAGLTSHQSKPMIWKTPLGFPVIHKYSEWKVKKIKIYLHDREAKCLTRQQVTLKEKPTHTIMKSKAKSAIAPNIIHSMDASHLLSTVLKGLENNVKDFFLIHDSFATTPSQTDILFRVVRESFVEMYENFDLYQSVLDHTARNLDNAEELDFPDLPTKGDLDLKGILKSNYCFA